MSKKLLSRLLSFTLSATVALTSGVPALAYDGGGGEELLEVEDEELLEIEDEIELEDAGADFDAQEEVIEDSEEFLETEDEAEFEALADLTVVFTTDDTVSVYDMNGTDYMSEDPIGSVTVDATMPYSFVVAPKANFELPSTLIVEATTGTYYSDYRLLENTAAQAWNGTPDKVEVKKVTNDTAIGYTVTDFALDSTKKVITLNQSLLQDVLAKFVDKNGKWAYKKSVGGSLVEDKSQRPTLTLKFTAANAEKFVVNQPTAKGGATAIEVIPNRRTVSIKTVNVEAVATTYSTVTGIGLEGTDYNIDAAKITVRISKDGQPINKVADGFDPEYKANLVAAAPNAVMTAAAPVAWNTADDELYLYQGLINEAYKNGWAIDIEIDVTQTPIAKNAISVADSTYAKVVKTSSDTLPSEYVKADGIGITVTGLADNDGIKRVIEKVEYSANGAEKMPLFTAGDVTTTDATIPPNLEGPVVIYVTTSERVVPSITQTDAGGNVETSTNAVVLAEDGSSASRAISGQPYKFSIRTRQGYKVGKVSYQVGGETKNTDLKADADGIYTTVNVTDTLEIAVEVVDGNIMYDVVKTDTTTATIRDENLSNLPPEQSLPTHHYATIVTTPTIYVSGDPGYTEVYGKDVATHNRQYYFSVTPSVGTNMITEVTYTMDGDSTKYTATLVNGSTTGTSVYKTVPVTGNVTITAVEKAYVTLSACGNNPAAITVTYDGKVLGGVPVQKDKDAVITVASKDSSYEITKITAGSVEIGKTAGTYSIAVSNATEIHVYTDHVIDPSKYSVVFKNKPGDAAESGTAKTDQLQNSYDASGKLVSQSLTLEVGETARLNEGGALSAVILKDGDESLTGTSLTLERGKTLGSVKVADIDNTNVTGYKAGTDTITATFTKNNNHNTDIYTAELPLTVVDQYTDLYIDGPDTVVEGSSNDLTIKGMNGRTGDEVSVYAGNNTKKIGKVVFSFEPDISNVTNKEYGFTSEYLANTPISSGEAKASFKAAKAQTKPVKVVATIYKKGNTDVYATLTKEINVVNNSRYYPVASLAIAEGVTYGLDNPFTSEDPIALDISGNKNTATASFDIYQIAESGLSESISDSAKLQKAIDKGELVKVDPSKITYKTSVKYSEDSGPRTVDYVGVSGSAGKFTVSALKKTPGATYETVGVTASINGVTVFTYGWKFTVTEKFANSAIGFTTAAPKYSGVATAIYEDEDGVATDTVEDAVVIPNTLKADYLNGYERSIVEDVATREYEVGAQYKVENETLITLPTEDDFVDSTRDKRAVLLGWIVDDAANILTEKGKTNSIIGFAPGAKVVVAADAQFTAVWEPRYTIAGATINNGVVKTDEVVDAEATAKALALDPNADTVMMDVYGTELTTIAKGVTVPATVKVTKPYSIKPADGSVLSQTVYLRNFSLDWAEGTTDSKKAAITLDGQSVYAKAIANTDEIGDVVATITDSEGATWTVVSSGNLAVVKETERTVKFAKATPYLADGYTDLTAATKLAKLTLEKSQTTALQAVWPVAFESGKNNSFLDLTGAKVEYSIDRNGIVTYENSTDVGNEFKLDVTPVAVGTANLTVTITDEAGNVCTGTLPIEVTEDKIDIQLTDKEGNAVTTIEALGNNDNATGAGEVYVKAILKEDSTNVAGDWGIDATGSEIVAGQIGSEADAQDGSGRKVVKFDTDGGILGTDSKNVFVTFTPESGVAYRKQITVTTFYNVVLAGSATYRVEKSAPEANDAYSMTGGSDYLFVLANGTRQLDAEETAASEKDYPALATIVKVTEADQEITRDNAGDISKQEITIDLSKYTAELVHDNKVLKTAEFKYWALVSDNSPAAEDELDTDDFANGLYSLYPQMGDATITSVAANVASITLVDEKDKNYANVTLNLTPEYTADTVEVFADNFGFFALTPDVAFNDYPADPAAITDEEARDGIALESPSGTAKFAVAMIPNKAGKTSLKIRSTADPTKVLATIPLRIDGLDVVSESEIYYVEDGERIKSAVRTIGDDTFAFGDDGKLIIGSKVYKLADGTSVVIRNGKVTTAGVWSIDDNAYITDENGTILSGWQTYADKKYYADPTNDNILVDGYQAIAGKHYYFRSHSLVTASEAAKDYELISGTTYYVNAAGELAATGICKVDDKDRLFRDDCSIVRYTDSDVIDGKITVNGIEYIIAEDNTAEIADIRYAPKVKFADFPENWKKGTAYPTITYTVKYQSAKEGKEITDPTVYTASVIAEPASIDATTKKVKFTATTNLSGFFADQNGTTPAENVSESKTYVFLDDSSDDSTEVVEISDDESGIVIVGLEEEYDYTKSAIKPVFDVLDTAGDTRILIKGTDYTVKFKDNTKPGTASIEIKGKGNYEGKALAATFKIVDRRAELEKDEPEKFAALGEVKSVKLATNKFDYTGKAIIPESITVKFATGSKTYTWDGSEYTDSEGEIPAVVTFANNIDAGTAKITVAGKSTIKSASFKINKVAFAAGSDGKGLEAAVEEESVQWAVKGAKASVTATWNGDELVEGRDFTVKYVYADKKTKLGAATVTITGKGNFKGKVENAASFTVAPLDEFKIVAAKTGKTAKSVKLTVVDLTGTTIPTSNYTVGVLDDSDNAYTGNLEAGKTYTFTATAKKEVLGKEPVSCKFTVAADFSKAKVKVLNKTPKTYDGTPQTFEDEEFDKAVQITVAGKTLKCGEDFEITNYTNNLKKGTMKVTLTGKGDYSGTKIVSLKIGAKKLTK